MGCDIHAYVEVRKNKKWISVDPWEPNPYYVPEDEDPEHPIIIPYDKSIFYCERNYTLFGILAEVRGSFYPPISLPKGLPKDTSPEVTNIVDRWGEDGHSHSWLTYKELIDYDWDQQIPEKIYMNIATYWNNIKINSNFDYPEFYMSQPPAPSSYKITLLELKEKAIEDFCQYFKLTRKEYELQEKIGSLPKKTLDYMQQLYKNHPHYTEYMIYHTPRKNCSTFWERTMPKLKKLADENGENNVRVVFFFDN